MWSADTEERRGGRQQTCCGGAATRVEHSSHQGGTIHSCHQGRTSLPPRLPPLTSASSPRANSLSSRLLTRRWRRLQTCSHVKWRLVVPPGGGRRKCSPPRNVKTRLCRRHECKPAPLRWYPPLYLRLCLSPYCQVASWGATCGPPAQAERYKARANSKLSSRQKRSTSISSTAS